MTARLAAALLSAGLPALAAAQVPIPLPKALVFPNYDNVLLGKDQALEAGAYIARAADASANFYNPAGLVQSEKTSLNASSTGWVLTRISSEALNTSVTSSKIDNVPGYFGAVVDPPFIGSRNIRIGLSLTRLVAWAPGPLDISTNSTSLEGLDRLTYSSSASFGTQLYQAAVAWAPVEDRSLRLGFSFGVANTSYSAAGTLSGFAAIGGQQSQFLATLRANTSEWDVIFGAGVQWDVTKDLTIGALIRAPGLRLGASSLLTYESSILSGTPSSTFYRDDGGRFEYKQPLEASIGIAYRFGDAQIEGDLRFHDATSSYEFYRPNAPLQVLTHNPDGTTTPSTQGLPAFTYASRRVFNASLGGNVRIGRIATLHGGFYTSFSPVADPVTAPFRQADLYGFTGGVDFKFEHFGASLGAGYQFGTSPTIGIAIGDQQIQGSTVKLQSISILYAISYDF